MTTTTPRTAIEARDLAVRNERARQIIAEGYSFFADADPDMDLVAVCKPGSLAAAYWITQRGTVCDCKDFEGNRKHCKHIFAWQIVQAEKIETLASTNVETVKEFCKERDERREIEAGMQANIEARLAQMDADFENTGLMPL